jgi:hypothetical protein
VIKHIAGIHGRNLRRAQTQMAAGREAILEWLMGAGIDHHRAEKLRGGAGGRSSAHSRSGTSRSATSPSARTPYTRCFAQRELGGGFGGGRLLCPQIAARAPTVATAASQALFDNADGDVIGLDLRPGASFRCARGRLVLPRPLRLPQRRRAWLR